MTNGEKPAVAPAMDAQQVAELVRAVDGLARQIEEGLSLVAELSGHVNAIGDGVAGNQATLRVVNNEIGNLGTAIRMTLDRLPAPGTLSAAPSEVLALKSHIREAHTEEAALVALLGGHVSARIEDIEQRAMALVESYHQIITIVNLKLEDLRDSKEKQCGQG